MSKTSSSRSPTRIRSERPNGGLTEAGALGIFYGSNNYDVANNTICSNFSVNYGAGVAHIGLSPGGKIHDNKIYYNDSVDSGAGLAIETELPVGAPASLGAGTGAVDIDRNLIQSNYSGFGSGLVPGDVGFALQNRGTLFALDPKHANHLEPHRRPFHTIIPGFVTRDGAPWLTFGVMGGDMQPQGQVEVLCNLIDFGMNIQEAGEAPRFRDSGNGVALESPFSADARAGLTSRGHRVTGGTGAWGGFQGILIDPKTRVLMAGSDPRKDGMAAGW